MQKFKKGLMELITSFFIALAIVFVVNFFVQPGRVSGDSMNDTYEDKDFVLIQKQFYNLKNQDIIVFKYSEEEKKYYEDIMVEDGYIPTQTTEYIDELHVKRVQGVPGDEVEIKDSVVFINGKEISKIDSHLVDQKYTIEEGEYFVQGDNLENSFDSRFHGPVSEEDIFGRLITKK